MLTGFKEFVLRGNVIDLAVGVVIGAAFTGIVTALVTGIFNPVIALIFNASDLSKAGITLRDNPGTDNDIVLAWGTVIAAAIQFLLVALVVYFALVVPMNRLKTVNFLKKEAEEVPTDPVPTELELLVQIRDLLSAQNAGDRRVESNPAFNSGAPGNASPDK